MPFIKEQGGSEPMYTIKLQPCVLSSHDRDIKLLVGLARKRNIQYIESGSLQHDYVSMFG
jgi:hypothetical protein